MAAGDVKERVSLAEVREILRSPDDVESSRQFSGHVRATAVKLEQAIQELREARQHRAGRRG